MKTKRVLTLLLITALLLSATVYAVEPRIVQAYPSVSFNGKTATCSVDVIGNNTTDKIFIAVELWYGNDCLKTWTDYGTAYLYFSDTYTVSNSGTYTLKVIVTINGTTYPAVTANGTCS